MSIMETYRTLESELYALIGPVKFSSEINLRLERMSHLLGLLDNPHYKFRSIHVGGTSGKGSTSTMIATILQEAGYYVGLHTSPNLQILNERHMLNGRPASTTKLLDLYQQMKPAIEEVGQTSKFGAPSYFEAQVAMTFMLFAQERVDFAVIEVGLGGDRDATNVLPAEVAVLNNVGLDHIEILGDTVEKIVLDKRGIIKRRQQVVSGVTQPSVINLVEEKCAEQGARLWLLNRDFGVQRSAGGYYSITIPDVTYDGLTIKMEGAFQATNAAVAVAAVASLHEITIPYSAILNGLAKATIPGRVEQVQEQPMVLLDGAHNPDKIRAAVGIIEKRAADQRVITVLGLKAGKAATDILPPVMALSDEVIFTMFEPKGLWNSVDADELAALAAGIDPDLPVTVEKNGMNALRLALSKANEDDMVWCTGSLYLIGDLREYWFPMQEQLESLEHEN
ncbi:MAG: Mur ligase family protein [Chloroflexota bacterium]